MKHITNWLETVLFSLPVTVGIFLGLVVILRRRMKDVMGDERPRTDVKTLRNLGAGSLPLAIMACGAVVTRLTELLLIPFLLSMVVGTGFLVLWSERTKDEAFENLEGIGKIIMVGVLVMFLGLAYALFLVLLYWFDFTKVISLI